MGFGAGRRIPMVHAQGSEAITRMTGKDPSVYEFDPTWYDPIYTGEFLVLGLAVGLLVMGLLTWASRRWCRRPGWTGVFRALFVALLAVMAAELVLWTATANMTPDRYLVWQGQFWRLRPNVQQGLDVQRQKSPDWVLTQLYGQAHLLKRLKPHLEEYRPEGWLVSTRVTSNSQGLREREIPLEKPPGEFRILCIGDSWTFGLGVDAEKAFPRQLEEYLSRKYPGRSLRVINAGIPACQYSQGFLMLKQVGMAYDPDLVLSCGFGMVDPLPVLGETEPISPVRAMLRRSILYGLLRQGISRATGRDEPRATMSRAEYATAIARYLSELGVPGLFFEHACLPGGAMQQSRRGEISPPIQDLYGVQGIPGQRAISLTPALLHDSLFPFMLREDPGHPSVLGHADMARLLGEYLVGEGYLEGRGPVAELRP